VERNNTLRDTNGQYWPAGYSFINAERLWRHQCTAGVQVSCVLFWWKPPDPWGGQIGGAGRRGKVETP
jgi:hypothetical protein